MLINSLIIVLMLPAFVFFVSRTLWVLKEAGRMNPFDVGPIPGPLNGTVPH